MFVTFLKRPEYFATGLSGEENRLPGAGGLWNKGAQDLESGMRKLVCLMLLPLALAGCGHGTGRTTGTAAGGAATGALIGIVGGPIGVVVGAGIGAGAGAMTAANTTPKQVNLGNAPWDKNGQ